MNEQASALAANGERDFELSHRDFERVRRLIHNQAGINLSGNKRDMVYGRLARRIRALRLTGFGEYLDLLQSNPHGDEWQNFVNALTTNLTSFFREAHHFDTLTTMLQSMSDNSPLDLWCSAASTGEEPYSMAIAACEAFSSNSPPVRIIATDIDTGVLQTARQGIYPIERVESLGEKRLKRFFMRGHGRNAGKVKIKPELAALIQFRPLNLLATDYGLKGGYAAIFCRNVMIYFDKPTQYDVLSRMVPLLAPHGRLFAGHSESFTHASDLVTPCGRTVYMRAGEAQR